MKEKKKKEISRKENLYGLEIHINVADMKVSTIRKEDLKESS